MIQFPPSPVLPPAQKLPATQSLPTTTPLREASRFEQARIHQLCSPYSPAEPPRLPLEFGDYLSLLWRADQAALFGQESRARYYRRCANALAAALRLNTQPLHKLVDLTQSGDLYSQLSNLPFRNRKSAIAVDAPDRRAAIAQLLQLRADMLKMATYSEHWAMTFPGAGILDGEIRERVFAVLFTAMQGQFANFARLLFVIDIVLADLLTDSSNSNIVAPECTLAALVADYNYPNPTDPASGRDYAGE